MDPDHPDFDPNRNRAKRFMPVMVRMMKNLGDPHVLGKPLEPSELRTLWRFLPEADKVLPEDSLARPMLEDLHLALLDAESGKRDPLTCEYVRRLATYVVDEIAETYRIPGTGSVPARKSAGKPVIVARIDENP